MIYSSPLLSTVESSVADREPVGYDNVIDCYIHDCIFTALIMIDYM